MYPHELIYETSIENMASTIYKLVIAEQKLALINATVDDSA